MAKVQENGSSASASKGKRKALENLEKDSTTPSPEESGQLGFTEEEFIAFCIEDDRLNARQKAQPKSVKAMAKSKGIETPSDQKVGQKRPADLVEAPSPKRARTPESQPAGNAGESLDLASEAGRAPPLVPAGQTPLVPAVPQAGNVSGGLEPPRTPPGQVMPARAAAPPPATKVSGRRPRVWEEEASILHPHVGSARPFSSLLESIESGTVNHGLKNPMATPSGSTKQVGRRILSSSSALAPAPAPAPSLPATSSTSVEQSQGEVRTVGPSEVTPVASQATTGNSVSVVSPAPAQVAAPATVVQTSAPGQPGSVQARPSPSVDISTDVQQTTREATVPAAVTVPDPSYPIQMDVDPTVSVASVGFVPATTMAPSSLAVVPPYPVVPVNWAPAVALMPAAPLQVWPVQVPPQRDHFYPPPPHVAVALQQLMSIPRTIPSPESRAATVFFGQLLAAALALPVQREPMFPPVVQAVDVEAVMLDA